MACGCNKGRAGQRRTTTPAGVAQAAALTEHEVVDSRGNGTGRRFTSLVAAAQYARRIGGTTRPVS